MLICTVVTLGYIGLCEWDVVPVSTAVIEISDVSQLTDGRIAYHVKLTDGYELERAKFTMDEQGNFYVTPCRPVIRSKADTNVGMHNSYYSFDEVEQSAYRDKYGADAKIKALYFGTPEDHILIWEQEMDLPPASAQVEGLLLP